MPTCPPGATLCSPTCLVMIHLTRRADRSPMQTLSVPFRRHPKSTQEVPRTPEMTSCMLPCPSALCTQPAHSPWPSGTTPRLRPRLCLQIAHAATQSCRRVRACEELGNSCFGLKIVIRLDGNEGMTFSAKISHSGTT